jgi:hypothetical protein
VNLKAKSVNALL